MLLPFCARRFCLQKVSAAHAEPDSPTPVIQVQGARPPRPHTDEPNSADLGGVEAHTWDLGNADVRPRGSHYGNGTLALQPFDTPRLRLWILNCARRGCPTRPPRYEPNMLYSIISARSVQGSLVCTSILNSGLCFKVILSEGLGDFHFHSSTLWWLTLPRLDKVWISYNVIAQGLFPRSSR